MRARLAQAWHCPPWVVDEAPPEEVERTLEMWKLEAQWKTQPKPQGG